MIIHNNKLKSATPQEYNNLEFLQCACRFTEESEKQANKEQLSKRREVKMLIKELKKNNVNIEQNIFGSIYKVHLDTFPGYKTNGIMHSFPEKYNE